jgi:hypothetical protein
MGSTCSTPGRTKKFVVFIRFLFTKLDDMTKGQEHKFKNTYLEKIVSVQQNRFEKHTATFVFKTVMIYVKVKLQTCGRVEM